MAVSATSLLVLCLGFAIVAAQPRRFLQNLRTVTVNDNDVMVRDNLPPIAQYRIEIYRYNVRRSRFDQQHPLLYQASSFEDSLPATIRLAKGYIYALRLVAMEEVAEGSFKDYPLKEQIFNADTELALPYQADSIQGAEEHHDASRPGVYNVTLSLPVIEDHLLGSFDTWQLRYKPFGSAEDESILETAVGNSELFLTDAMPGFYQYELKLLNKVENTEALAGGIQFYRLASESRSASCPPADKMGMAEGVDVVLHGWSIPHGTWRQYSVLRNQPCSKSPFSFTALPSNLYSLAIVGSVSNNVYVHNVDKFPDAVGETLAHTIITVPFNMHLPVMWSGLGEINIQMYWYTKESGRFSKSFVRRQHVQMYKVKDLPAVVSYPNNSFLAFVVNGHHKGMDNCLSISTRKAPYYTGLIPYQKEGLTVMRLKQTYSPKGIILTLPAISAHLKRRFTYWRLRESRIPSAVRYSRFAHVSQHTMSLGNLPVGEYEFELELINHYNGHEAIAGTCIFYEVTDDSYTIPCPVSAVQEQVMLRIFHWTEELEMWMPHLERQNITCTAGSFNIRLRQPGHFSYAVTGQISKHLKHGFTSKPDGNFEHVYLSTIIDTNLAEEFYAKVFRYNNNDGHFDRSYPTAPFRNFKLHGLPTVIPLSKGYYYVVQMAGTAFGQLNCLGVRMFDLSNGEVSSAPYQTSGIVRSTLIPESDRYITQEVVVPPIAKHLQGKYDTWQILVRKLNESNYTMYHSSVADPIFNVEHLEVDNYEYQLRLYNSTDGSEAFAGDCDFYGFGTKVISLTCPPDVDSYGMVDVFVFRQSTDLRSMDHSGWDIYKELRFKLCSEAPFVFSHLSEGRYATLIRESESGTIYSHSVDPVRGEDNVGYTVLQNPHTDINLAVSRREALVYRYNQETMKFEENFPTRGTQSYPLLQVPTMVALDKGGVYATRLEAHNRMCLSTNVVDLSDGDFVPYQASSIKEDHVIPGMHFSYGATLSLVMPVVEEHLVGLFDTWTVEVREVILPDQPYRRQSIPINSTEPMQIHNVTVGLHEYQLKLENSVTGAEALSGSCGLYEIKNVVMKCLADLKEEVDIHVYRLVPWSDNWMMVIEIMRYTCDDVFSFMTMDDVYYAYTIRGTHSRHLYEQKVLSASGAGPDNCYPLQVDLPVHRTDLPADLPEMDHYNIEVYEYNPETGKFGEQLPGKPTSRFMKQTLPALVCTGLQRVSYITIVGVDMEGRSFHISNNYTDLSNGPIPVVGRTIAGAISKTTANGRWDSHLEMPKIPELMDFKYKYDTWKLIYKHVMSMDYKEAKLSVEEDTMVIADLQHGGYEYMLLLTNNRTGAEAIFGGFFFSTQPSPLAEVPSSDPEAGNRSTHVLIPLSKFEDGFADAQYFKWNWEMYQWVKFSEDIDLRTGSSVDDYVVSRPPQPGHYAYLLIRDDDNGNWEVLHQEADQPVPGQTVGMLAGFKISLSQPFSGIATTVVAPSPQPTVYTNVMAYRLPNFITRTASGISTDTVLLDADTVYSFYVQRFTFSPRMLEVPSPILAFTTPELHVQGTCDLGCTNVPQPSCTNGPILP